MSEERGRGRRIVRRLIEIGAVSLSPDSPFTWASGLKSPIYCDNRATLAHPDVRKEIAEAFVEKLDAIDGSVDAVVGVATGAIAHAAFVAERSRLPLGYIRASAKEHGRQNRLEGFSRDGARVVVIEDLISTGKSSLAAVEGVRESGLEVAAVIAIFTYGFPFAHAAFDDAGVELQTLAELEDLIRVEVEMGSLGDDGIEILQSWRQDPVSWSDSRG